MGTAEASGEILDALLAKETINSAYGKMGQDLKNKSAFDTTKGDTDKIGPSLISSPFFAGFITAVNREVSAEITNT